MRTVLSYDPDATLDPSGLQHTDHTAYQCPSMVVRHSPVASSQTRTVLSSDPEALLAEGDRLAKPARDATAPRSPLVCTSYGPFL